MLVPALVLMLMLVHAAGWLDGFDVSLCGYQGFTECFFFITHTATATVPSSFTHWFRLRFGHLLAFLESWFHLLFVFGLVWFGLVWAGLVLYCSAWLGLGYLVIWLLCLVVL